MKLPDPAITGKVSLDEILAYADAHAPDIRIASAMARRAEVAGAAAHALFPDNPQLTIGAGPRRSAGGRGIDVEASIEQRVEIGGQRGLRGDLAEASRKAAAARVEETRWITHQLVHQAFHIALVSRDRVAAAVRLLDFSDRMVTVANKRLAAGDISRLQLRLAEGELAIAREKKIAAEQAYLGARITLAQVAGWPADRPPEPAGVLDPPRRAPVDLLARALARHPSLAARTAAVEEAKARGKLADRGAWPDVTVGLSVEREAAVEDGADPVVIALLSLGIALPFWQRNQVGRAEAHVELAIASAELDALRGALSARVARTGAQVTAAALRIEVYGADILPRFEENLRLLARAFELGEIDVLELLVARERFLEVQREVLDAYTDYFDAVGALEAEIGEEIWPDEDHDREDEKP